MKKTNLELLLALSLICIFSTAGFAADMNNSRMMPEGKVIVSQDGKVIAEYSKEMPVPEGALLICQGKCAIKMNDMLLVAEDQSQFSIDIINNQRVLIVKEGTVYFGLSTMPRTVVLVTPKGAVSANQVLINASAGNAILEGYVKVSETSSEVGVLSGGQLPLMTEDGSKLLKPGQRFLLAQADMEGGDAASQEETKRRAAGYWWGLSGGQIAGITAGTVAIGGLAYALERHNDDHDGSPSKPKQ